MKSEQNRTRFLGVVKFTNVVQIVSSIYLHHVFYYLAVSEIRVSFT